MNQLSTTITHLTLDTMIAVNNTHIIGYYGVIMTWIQSV